MTTSNYKPDTRYAIVISVCVFRQLIVFRSTKCTFHFPRPCEAMLPGFQQNINMCCLHPTWSTPLMMHHLLCSITQPKQRKEYGLNDEITQVKGQTSVYAMVDSIPHAIVCDMHYVLLTYVQIMFELETIDNHQVIRCAFICLHENPYICAKIEKDFVTPVTTIR